MGTRRTSRRTMRPATSPEERENQLISLAYDRAEKQLIEDSASSQVITHFLKLGSRREQLEQARIERENLLLSAKVEQLSSSKRVEELYERALHAMREYSGREIEEDDYDDYDD